MKRITRESIIEETDLAFKVYEDIKHLDHEAKYRLMQIIERLWSQDRMYQDMVAKEAYAAGRPIAVRDPL